MLEKVISLTCADMEDHVLCLKHRCTLDQGDTTLKWAAACA